MRARSPGVRAATEKVAERAEEDTDRKYRQSSLQRHAQTTNTYHTVLFIRNISYSALDKEYIIQCS